MSRHNHKRHYSHSSLLVLAIVVSSSLSLIFFLLNDIYAQNESNITSPQVPNQGGEQGQTFQNGTSNNDNPLIMTTDQNIYSPGETVNITMTNTGEEPLTFPNSALGLMIRNLATNESSSVIWDPVASNGNPVPPGDYIASVMSGSSTTNVIFSIVKQIP